MNVHTEHKLIAFLFGIFIGILLGVRVRYPIDLNDLQRYQVLCGTEKIAKARIGISGDIYYITCSNGITIRIK